MKDIQKMRKLVVIGDSWTYGSEIKDPSLPKEVEDWDQRNDEYRLPKIWPTKLANLMGFDECINLSYPAASNDRSVRILVNWLTQEYFLKNKPTDEIFVIVGLTSPERKDFYYRDEDKNQNFWMTMWPMWKHDFIQEPINEFADLYVKHFWNKEEYTNRYVNQLLYLQTLFQRYSVNYLMFQAFYQYEHLAFKDWVDNPYARNYDSSIDSLVWELIDPIRFVNKNSEAHSFHNYITNKDATENKKIALLEMHPTETGHTWWAEYIFEYIKKYELLKMDISHNTHTIKHNNLRRII